MKPVRIQRKRTKGWRMPPNTVCVTRPGKWGNPHKAGGEFSVEWAVIAFRAYANEQLRKNPNWLDPLRGKNLACFCKIGDPCHADVLLELANPDRE